MQNPWIKGGIFSSASPKPCRLRMKLSLTHTLEHILSSCLFTYTQGQRRGCSSDAITLAQHTPHPTVHTPSSPLSYEWDISHMNGPCDTWMSHGTYEWVVSRMNGSCHAWVRSTPAAPRHILRGNFRLHETNKTWVFARVPSASNINDTHLIRQWCTVRYRSESATHKCTHVRTHTHIHIHMHKHAHTHTHAHTRSQFVHINSWIL